MTHFKELKLRQNLKKFLEFWYLSTKLCLMMHLKMKLTAISQKRQSHYNFLSVWVSALLSAFQSMRRCHLIGQNTMAIFNWKKNSDFFCVENLQYLNSYEKKSRKYVFIVTNPISKDGFKFQGKNLVSNFPQIFIRPNPGFKICLYFGIIILFFNSWRLISIISP